MASYDKDGLIFRLKEKRTAIIARAKSQTIANKAAFAEWKSGHIKAVEKALKEMEQKLITRRAMTFGDHTLRQAEWREPVPVEPDTAAVDRAIAELELIIGGEVKLNSSAFLELL